MFMKIVATASQSRIPLPEVLKVFDQSKEVRISMQRKYSILREALNTMMRGAVRNSDDENRTEKAESATDDIPPPSFFMIKSRSSSIGDDRGGEERKEDRKEDRKVPRALPESALCKFGHIPRSRSASTTEYTNSDSDSNFNSSFNDGDEKRVWEKASNEAILLHLASNFLESEESEEKKEFTPERSSMDIERWNVLVKLFLRKLFLSHFIEGYIENYQKMIPIHQPVAVRAKVQSPHASPNLPHLRSRSTPGSFACTNDFPTAHNDKAFLNCSMNLSSGSGLIETSKLKSTLTDKLVKGNRYNTALNIESRRSKKKLTSLSAVVGNEERRGQGIGGAVKKLFFSDNYNSAKTSSQSPLDTNHMVSPRLGVLPTISPESIRYQKNPKEKKFRFSDLNTEYTENSPDNAGRKQHSSLREGATAEAVIHTARMFTRQFGSKRFEIYIFNLFVR